MSFNAIIDTLNYEEMQKRVRAVSARDVELTLGKEAFYPNDFPVLVSDAADAYLEQIAQIAHRLTRKQFGNVIFMFTPFYISNYCINTCDYCSFARQYKIDRKQLKLDEVRKEAEKISSTGMRNVLILTGEAQSITTLHYIAESVAICTEYFSSIGIEIYPLPQSGYKRLFDAGTDALTIYQEVYNKDAYTYFHRAGPKADYAFRLDAPERACNERIHAVTIGPLLGLADYQVEAWCTALHLDYLTRNYPGTEMSISLPRLRPLVSEFKAPIEVDRRQFVRLLMAFRLVFPYAGITVSTRESPQFRNNLLPLGVTKMSAGVSTAVGGHGEEASTGQFEIDDQRSLAQMKQDLLDHGFQPVTHDWSSKLLKSGIAQQFSISGR
ncbi:MAG: 2-iminoacetate synthase ThiH [Chitinivibrionales bacterium]|nr:2-iminoacetate synthase ThiH [Chitinivibrionales bacterium]